MRMIHLLTYGVIAQSCLFKGPSIVNEGLSPSSSEQHLDIANFSDADWEYFGFYDGGGAFEHQYGGKSAGFYEYRFRAESQPPKAVKVRARLSAESHSKGLPEEKSDVWLSINGQNLGLKTVVPDDTIGAVYEWQVTDPAVIAQLKLQAGEQNFLRFTVPKDARNQNGLCLYGQALEPGKTGTPMTIELQY